jgi:tetratricopeptide (TPR) repeat protein
MALANSNSNRGRRRTHLGSVSEGVLIILCLAIGLPWILPASAADATAAGSGRTEVVDVRAIYAQAQKRYQDHPLDDTAAWQFARACFDLADVATNRTERAAIAQRGITVARQLVDRAPALAQARYYLGMNQAQLAQTKGLGALKLVKQMEHEFNLARELDERFDFAGPDRNLGLLYRDAPAIGSIGSRSKAREHLEHAVKLAPDYPENRLNLAESYVKWGDRVGAMNQLKALEELWPRAHTNLAGAAWASSWADWDGRLKLLRSKLGNRPAQ